MNLPQLPHGLPYISGPDEITNAGYHHSELYSHFISSTSLKNYLISPKYARYTQLNPRFDQTKAMQEGSVYHDYLASLVNYGDLSHFDWITFDKPPVNAKTGKPYGKETDAFAAGFREFMDANPGKQIAEPGFIQNVERMVGELLHGNRHLSQDVQFMMKNGMAEQSHFCEYEGGLWKFRTDLKTRNKIIDWKKTTFENPKVDEFHSQILKYNYHISAAMYQFFDAIITGKWRPFYWVVQENESPYDFTILDSSDWSWEISRGSDGEQIVEPKVGARHFLALKDQHLHCLSEDYWPGYSIFIEPNWKGRRIGVPRVPGWYKGRIINFYNEKNDRSETAE